MRNRLLEKCVRCAAVLALALALPACVGYRIGTMLPPDVKSVYIPTFVNNTDEPMVESEATRATVAEMQRDASLKVAQDEASADALLKVNVNSYQLIPLAYDRGRKERPNEYRVLLTASLVLTSTKTGKVIAQDGRARGEAIIEVSGDMTTAKQSGLPMACKDLAHQIVEKLVEAW